ncbi:MAG: haloacid dehalogenase-like hydrolase, partial [Tannerellaceae bacterium]|nr:haloacid dehalogenase-like hydrolase [Tannerellaceae bacterium]
MRLMEELEDNRKVIVVFDFDGTIISRDSLRDFLSYTFGRTAFLLRLPLILILKLAALTGIMTTRRAKEHLLSSFMKGMTYTRFQEACRQYALRIPSLAYPEALQEIKNHLELGRQVLIISASIADWIRPWAETVGISRVEGSELEIENGRLTGRLSTPNCKGKEKVNRLFALFPDRERYVLYAYGDSPGDKALLAVADYPVYKPAWRKAKHPLFPLSRIEKGLFCLFFLVYGWIGYRMLFLTELIDVQNGGAGSYLGYDNLFHLKTNGGSFDVSHPFFSVLHIAKYIVTKPFTLLLGEKARAVICLLSMNILVSAGLTMLYRYMKRIVGIQAKRAALLTLFTGSFFTTVV